MSDLRAAEEPNAPAPPATGAKLFFLDQHGCAKNQVDGELIIARMRRMGWARTENPAEAALVIVNSCGFIEAAKAESLDSAIQARSSCPGAKILLAGCLAERYHEELYDSLAEIDGILGNGDLALLDEAVEDLMAGKRPKKIAPQAGVCCGERAELLSFAGSAYVKITEGCDNRCSFCAIPLIRGALRSRPAAEIIEEIERLLARGVKEINLIGQDLASYGKDFAQAARAQPAPEQAGGGAGASSANTESALARLLRAICKIEGDFWLRLLYIHPDNFPPDILPVIAANRPRILPYFDIPFQSGDDATIAAMNRRGSAEKYGALVEQIRAQLPDAVLRTTFLVGFPGETDGSFENTAAFLRKIEPDWAGCFVYSREEGTRAAGFARQVPARKAKKRAALLEGIQQGISERRLLRRVGENCDILVEEFVPAKAGEETGFFIGRAWFQAPEVDGAAVIGYDLADSEAAKRIAVGARISAKITGINGVDIEGFAF